MKTLWNLINRSFMLRGPVLITAGLVLIVLLLTIPPSWEYSNSVSFCGETCHTMPPALSTYEVSPHSRVLCVDCHIGRDLIAVQFSRKIGHSRLLVATVLDRFEYPIRTHSMRPAADTCEVCHSPEKFSDDSLRVLERSENNRSNDPYQIYLLMHTGGGSEREGLSLGIHWHIENKIEYIALDDLQQEIPWVRIHNDDGTTVDYNSINSPIDTTNLDQYELYEMDCMTCHNRIAHEIANPSDAVDQALAQGDISRDIPFIRVRGVEVLTTRYSTLKDAHAAIGTLDDYYSENYPDFYADNSELVTQAIDVLSKVYDENNFPEQKLDWETHPNNTGHRDSPGCFRCHDGEHFSDEGQAVRLECNLCHSIPEIVRPGNIEPTLALATGLEPQNHLDSTWISRHHTEFDASCSNCHTISNPGGTDDTSFCSNSGCHANEWEYAGFDAPGLASVLGFYQFEPEPLLVDFIGEPTYEVLAPLFSQQCAGCHGDVPSKGLQVTSYAALMAGSETGAVIIPGNPDESLIVQTLEGGHFAELTAHQMDLLREWILTGTPES